ncbi:hypothetical protein [Chitinophaga sancti]|uniref:Tubulin like n=1 Tax=Chitinophaga sancti TaxID=1004 RepID=A0A1K1SHG7_9BACT|nr:hypothetical protein [Chitinophaga sancti]WQD59869.1 hypothetical protein U0033_18430 [Chitinophaga sancti]WQG88000.1 hypothetical protein SR876_24035 [Chitinophaga sancti]SFW83349.1 hypothetical protein SAMN05661012_05394 [Chitinophaga sancti]
MARLFIFAIGGTGSRVLKSLTMLLAAGVRANSKHEFEIVPIIIDPHKSNEDLKRTERLLGNYQAIVDHAGLGNGFFNTRIVTLNKLVSSENRMSGSFAFSLQQVAGQKFRDYIDFNQLDAANKALTDILFSGQSINKRHEQIDLLDIEMDIGFVGNPNIGSVVLNQFKDSEEFKEFASNFNAEDRVFIISSIFGGTGAAGFPTILKNIRDAMNNRNIDGKGFLQDAKIGALTAMPYFNIEKEADSPIQKSDFIAKTKAALYYYKDNVTGNNSVNALYYIGDDYSGKPYKNDPGDNGQQNDAHFVEFAAALAIIDFMEIPDADLECDGGKAIRPVYKEFATRNDVTDIAFSDFEDYTQRKTELPLSQFVLFKRFLDEHISTAAGKEAWSNDAPELDQKFLDDRFYRTNISEFLHAFGEWLREMSNNKRGFAPFNLNAPLDAIIKNRNVNKGWFTGKVDYAMYDSKLSKLSKGKSYSSAQQKLVQLFFEATEDILTSKFGLKN